MVAPAVARKGIPNAARTDAVARDHGESGGSATLGISDGAFAQVACAPVFSAGSLQRIFASPETIGHAVDGNGYRSMLAAAHAAIGDGCLQHPQHDADSTIGVLRTLDVIAAASGLSPRAPDGAVSDGRSGVDLYNSAPGTVRTVSGRGVASA